MKTTFLFCVVLASISSSFGQVTGTNLITVQPQSQTAQACGNVTFDVSVAGTGPFSYQWQFNGTNISNSDVIITVAGNGVGAFSGDGGAATNASLAGLASVAVDSVGNLFIADYNNQRIRKVNTFGIITTVAGNGNASFSGDGGPATNASINFPFDVVVDGFGNMFISDHNNNRIRKVDTNGIIRTYAGNGANTFGGDGGQATNASLNNQIGIALDASGNLFIADLWNDRVRKVGTNGIITTVAGNGAGGALGSFSGDGGQATNAALALLTWVCTDASGNLFIADRDNERIRKVAPNGIITTMVGNGNQGFSGDSGPATNASLNYPYGIRTDSFGNLFIADGNNQRIRKVNTNGNITTFAGTGAATYSGDGGPPTLASLNSPTGLAVNGAGDLFIADALNNRVRKVAASNSANPTLTLYNLTTNDAGNYTVIVSYLSQSVTSSVALLQIAPSPAIATATLTNGFVVAANVIDGGCGYTNAPLVLIQGGGGTGAAATAFVSNGMVTGITITDAGSNYTSVPAILIGESPSIAGQPQSVTVEANVTASFYVAAVSTVPLYYQWSFDGTNMSGATSSAITITNVVQTNLGTYAVVVSNAFGTIVSSNAALSMYPFLAAPFGGLDTYWGYTNTLTVGAWGTGPLSYQWFENGVAIDNATNASLILPNIQFTNGGLYSVVVTSPLGSVTNASEEVVVNPAGSSLGLYPGVEISGVVGYNYIIQRTADLGNSNSWVTVANVTLSQPVQVWVDTNINASLPGNPRQYYLVLPAP